MAISDHAKSLITQAAPLLDAASDTPDLADKQRLFTEGWRIVEPAMHGMARRKLNGDNGDRLIRDTMTETATKLWGSISRGYKPDAGWVAGLYRIPQFAAVNVLKRTATQRAAAKITTSLEQRGPTNDTASEPFAALMTMRDDADLADDLDRIDLRTRLDRAARRAHHLDHPIATRILVLGIHDTPAGTADDLGITTLELRRALDWIRTHEYELFVVSDTRFREHLRERLIERAHSRPLELAVGA